MGTLFVDKLDPQSGTSLEIGSSGDTISVPSGATFDVPSGATLDVTGATVSGLTIGDNKPIFYAHNQNSQTISNNTFTVVQFDTDRTVLQMILIQMENLTPVIIVLLLQ